MTGTARCLKNVYNNLPRENVFSNILPQVFWKTAIEIEFAQKKNVTRRGIGPVKLHAVVPKILEAIAKREKNGN